jgi:hypothetical protein
MGVFSLLVTPSNLPEYPLFYSSACAMTSCFGMPCCL